MVISDTKNQFNIPAEKFHLRVRRMLDVKSKINGFCF